MNTKGRLTLALLLGVFLAGCGGGALQRGNTAFASGQFDLAAQQWNPLANAGDPFAQYNLGLIWESGLGSTPKNDSNAADWFIQSARQGYVPAMIKLAQTQTRMGYYDSGLSGMSWPHDGEVRRRWLRCVHRTNPFLPLTCFMRNSRPMQFNSSNSIRPPLSLAPRSDASWVADAQAPELRSLSTPIRTKRPGRSHPAQRPRRSRLHAPQITPAVSASNV